MRTNHIILVLVLLFMGGKSLFAQKPTADFTASKTSGCAPLSVVFTDKSTNKPTSWNWKFGTNQLDQRQNPTVTFNQPGTYTVRLVVSNSSGSDDEIKTNYITVYPSATVNFKASTNISCSPASIKFTDLSTVPSGNIVGWTWDFGDGTAVDHNQNPTHSFTSLGYYNVSLTVKTSAGCEVTGARTRFIRIINGVTPNFDFTRTNDCAAPVAVTFINQTTGPGTLVHKWSLGNGDNQTIKNPSTIYNALGTYTVKLETTSSYGCSGSISKPITFSGNNTSFTGPDSTCPGNPVTLINKGSPTPTKVLWDFGDSTSSSDLNPVKVYNTPGTYTIKLTNQYAECTGVFTKKIKITNPPVIDFTATNPLGCTTPHTVNFKNLTPGASNILWDFGDGSTSNLPDPQHTYTSEGNFNVSLTVTTANGCPSTLTKNLFVKIAKPGTINFSGLPAEGCMPLTINPSAFINTIDGVASYAWDFGVAGGTGSGVSPSFTYTTAGTFDVSVKITTNGGCVQNYTLAKAVKTGTKPTVNFSTGTDTTCAGDTVYFKSTSTPADKWLWDFGDKGVASNENPAHLYQDTGKMTVTLIAFNNGCADTLTKPDLLYTIAPVAKFDPVYNCANPLSVTFTNSSITDPKHGTTTYFWDLGNGQTSAAFQPPPTIYPAFGTYNVTLKVKDNLCEYTKTQTITVLKLLPDITINKPTFCRGEIFTLTATNVDLSQVKRYTWKIGSATGSDGGSTFDSSILVKGAYDVTLTLEDIHGCISSIKKSGFIKIVGSDADFSVTNNGGCLNSKITLTDLSTPSGTITNWKFDYGDGKSESFTAAPFVHSYDKVGTYDIKLTTTDNFGCIDTITKTAIATITKPAVNFGARDTVYCPNLNLQFIDSTIGTNLSYAWDFGDGKSSTGKDPLHTYAGPDSVYSVKLIVTDKFGCIDSLERLKYIRVVAPKPLFSIFDSASICPPLETKFFSDAKDYDSLYWDFGDGNTSTLPNTSNFYNTYGRYTAKLYTRGYGGCIDSASAIVNLYNPFTYLNFTFGPKEACNEITTTFNGTPPPGTKFRLIFGDGSIDSSQTLPISHTYKRPNYYTPYVELTDSLNCLVAVGNSQKVLVKGVYPLFDMDKKKFCDTGSVQMTDYSIGNDSITNRLWDFGDGTTSDLENPIKYYKEPGTYLVSQKITTITGCFNSYTDTVRVYLTPVPIILGPNEICINNSIQLNATTQVADTVTNWRWTYGNGASSTNASITNRYTVAGPQNVTLTATNTLGCSNDTASIITVWPLPVITNEPEVVIPVGTGINLPITYSSNVSTWTWTPPTSLSCTNCAVPYSNPRFTTTYKIAVIDSNGCRANSSMVVRVICVDKNYFIPNTFSPNNDGQNDVFYPRGNGVDRIQSMRIFNRWGELVFERKNFPANTPSEGWNGQYKGAPAQSDTYVYIVEVICDNAQIVPLKGNVTLIR
ncbi:PKD domain-containing protein [Flavihumibacter profundi]|uniref:PKD domain-containing protein n=1 Tax=Flavihumibacter profundi TaxID=2716883 RepID=UPI001CC6CE94|nr:PKD domain-containing protein [Flavihumibacter profundi]MBZ5859251.1 PKD domain-containing protein [Flavihumibacter profundi]